MNILEFIGLEYLCGWLWVFFVRAGWMTSPSLYQENINNYRAVVYWDGSVEWRKK
jgi:hypothetical protein